MITGNCKVNGCRRHKIADSRAFLDVSSTVGAVAFRQNLIRFVPYQAGPRPPGSRAALQSK